MLRHATSEDIDLIMSMADKFSRTISTAAYVQPETIRKLVENLINEGVILLHGEEGMLAAYIHPYLLGSDTKEATEIAWWVEPHARERGIGAELVKAYEEWARQQGCQLISMAHYNKDELGPFYKKMGYSLNELGYIKEL